MEIPISYFQLAFIAIIALVMICVIAIIKREL